MDAISTTNLTKTYQDTVAVDGLNLTIRQGELFSLLGTNGAGKTTALKMLACLTTPTAGDAWIMGHSITGNRNDITKIIGVSPQETAIAPNLSVRENLELICGIYGFTPAQCREKVAALSGLFELTKVLSKKAGKLSGGWQRRLSIAMALIGQPEILFLDEPTLGLDVLARRSLWDIIRQLKGKITVILTTHYMEEAQALSDRIGVMKDGTLLTVGTARELMDQTNTDKFEDAFIAIVGGVAP